MLPYSRIVYKDTGVTTFDGFIGCLTQQNMINIFLMPAKSCPLNFEVEIKDVAGSANINNIQLVASLGDTIDGQRSQVINQSWGVLKVINTQVGWSIDSSMASGGGTTYTAGNGLSLTGTTFALTTPVSVLNGGTGSTVQNFVDLSSTQSVGGNKSFTGNTIFNGTTTFSGPVNIAVTVFEVNANVTGTLLVSQTTNLLGALNVSGTATFTNSINGTAYPYFGTPTVLSSVTSTISQANATPITALYTQVTGFGSGNSAAVVLPSNPIIGQEYVIELNRTTSNLFIYPQSGAQIDLCGANQSVLLNTVSASTVTDVLIRLIPTSNTQWKVSGRSAQNNQTAIINSDNTAYYQPQAFHDGVTIDGAVGGSLSVYVGSVLGTVTASNLNITGNTSLSGNTVIGGTLSVTGNAIMDAGLKFVGNSGVNTFNVPTGQSLAYILSDGVVNYGIINSNSSLQAYSIGSGVSFNVSGTTTLASLIATNTILSNLTVSGASVVNSTLSVSGNTTLQSLTATTVGFSNAAINGPLYLGAGNASIINAAWSFNLGGANTKFGFSNGQTNALEMYNANNGLPILTIDTSSNPKVQIGGYDNGGVSNAILKLGTDAQSNSTSATGTSIVNAVLLTGGTNNQNAPNMIIDCGPSKGTGTPGVLNILAAPLGGSSTNTLNASITVVSIGYDTNLSNAGNPSLKFGTAFNGFDFTATTGNTVFLYTAGSNAVSHLANGSSFIVEDGSSNYPLSVQTASGGGSVIIGEGSSTSFVATGNVNHGCTIVPKTSSYTVAGRNVGSGSAGDCLSVFTNTSAAGSLTLSLPTAAAGLVYDIGTSAAHSIIVQAVGSDVIYLNTTISSSGGGTVTSPALIGASTRLVGITTNVWLGFGTTGPWTSP